MARGMAFPLGLGHDDLTVWGVVVPYRVALDGRISQEAVDVQVLFFFFITPKPRIEWYIKSMSLKYEPASAPLHISVTYRVALDGRIGEEAVDVQVPRLQIVCKS